jgi:hypothetical protein
VGASGKLFPWVLGAAGDSGRNWRAVGVAGAFDGAKDAAWRGCGWGKRRGGRGRTTAPIRSFVRFLNATPLDGRLYLLLSTDDDREPRFQISDQPDTQQFFGINVDGWAPSTAAVFDSTVIGYPLDNLSRIVAGDYYAQSLLNIYTTFHRADGHTVKLPMDEGEGQQWNRKPGNLLSEPIKVHIDPAAGGVVRIKLSRKIDPTDFPQDTPYVKHFRMQSAVLTKFWGRPMYLGAHVLLPAGWAEHPNAHYPVMILQGHFSSNIFDSHFFVGQPPDASMHGRQRVKTEAGYAFYQKWVSGGLPRMIIVDILHANPFYDDSYAVDSANVGPYGTAIMRELIPAVEKRYRGIGQGWARGLYGGSTGGWEALADQVFYPDDFNGAWASCPDPVDFRAYQIVNIYDDANALWTIGPGGTRMSRPAERRTDGTIVTTMERENRRELVLGDHGRSTEQFGIWQAVYSPIGEDGYPQPIWDPFTGVIDHTVAQYWKEHYDLRAILQRDWPTLGPKLVGKIHVNVGTMDTYYLNNAVVLLQQFMESTKNPHDPGDFHYGIGQPHCWTGGDPNKPSGMATMNQLVLPAAAAWMTKTAPAGADLKSWKY